MSSYSISWVKQQALFNTTGAETNPRIVTDSANNIYMTYNTASIVSSGVSAGLTDVVVAKFNSLGALLWIKQQTVMNTTSSDTFPTIAVDVNSNVYVTYYTSGTVSGGTNLGGSGDVVVFKMDTNGAMQWIKEQSIMNTTLADTYPAIAVDISGNSYISYFTTGIVSGGTNLGGSGDIVVFKMDTSGTLQWIKELANMNTTSTDYYPAIGVDNAGNSYVAYCTFGTTTGGTLSGAGTADIAVFKLNASGTFQWVKQTSGMNTTGNDYYPWIVTDSAGNSYVTYYTTGTVSGGTTVGGGYEIVVFKMDTNGNVVWIKEQAAMNTAGAEYYPTISIDSAGNSYVAYYTTGTVSGGTFLGTNDIAVFKLDANGAVQWVTESNAFNSTGSEIYPSIAVDRYGNVNIAYQTSGTVSGGTLLGSTDIVLAQILQPVSSPANYVAWVKELAAMNTTAAEGAMRLKTDALGNSYIVYTTAGTVSGGTYLGNTDIVLAKVSSGGILQWVKELPSFNTSAQEAAPMIAVDVAGNSYITYFTYGTVSGGTYMGTYQDIVVAKFDTNGNLVWIKENNTLNTTGTESYPSIAVDPTGTNVYISYYSYNPISGGTNIGQGDIVIAKMVGATGLITWIKQLAVLNTTAIEQLPALAIDSAGNSYVAYQTGGTVSGGTFMGGSYDIAIAKVDTNGIAAWVKQPFQINTSATENTPISIAVDAGNNVYLAYTTTGTVSGGTFTGGASPGDVVVAKLNSNGILQWVKEQSLFNSTLSEWETNITVDSCGNAYVAYTSSGTVSGGTNIGPSDITIAKFTNTGTLATLLQLPAINTTGNEGTPSISLDAAGNMYIGYYSSGTVSGGTYLGGNDVAIAKLVQYMQTPTVPSAPTSVTAVSGDSTSAIVSWTPATNLYNAVVQSYTVTSSPGGFTATVDGSLTSATVTGLTYNTAYTFAVTATNSVGTSSAANSSSITIYSAPSAPTNLSYTYGNGQITVSWSAPASSGDSALASYTVTCWPFESTQTTANASTTSATFTGLTNGTPYTFNVYANNQYVTGPAATLSNCICSTVPGAPTFTPFSGDIYGSINVRCNAPTSNGGRAITSYTVTANPGGATATATAVTGQTTFVAVFTNLTQAQVYTFTGYATNVDGNSAVSAASVGQVPSSDLYYVDWIKQYAAMNSTGTEYQPNVGLDAAGNAYITYGSNGTVSGGTNTSNNYTVVIAKLDKRGKLQWIKQQAAFNTLVSTNNPSIAVDASGNSYVTYFTAGTVSGGVFSGGSSGDIVAMKMDTYGNIIWIQQQAIMNTTGSDINPTVAIDLSSNVYIVYNTPGGTVSGGTNMTGTTTNNVVIMKLNTNGRMQWIRETSVMNTTNSNNYPLIAVDISGNSYVTYMVGATVSGGTYLGNNDIAVFKMDTNGTLLWIKELALMNTTGTEQYPSIAVDTTGNSYIGYMTQGTLSGGVLTGFNSNVALAKLDTNGTLQWLKEYAAMNTTSSQFYPRVNLDAAGNLYVYYMSSGTVSGGINIGATTYYSPVLVKLNSSGTILSIKQQVLMGYLMYGSGYAIGYAVDSSGNVVLAYSSITAMSGGTFVGGASDIVVVKMAQHTLSTATKPTVSVSSQNLQAVVSWLPDTSLYVNPITSYSILMNPGNVTTTISDPTQTSATITGLTGGGTNYTFTVTANTASGSVSSDPVSATIYGQPSAPTGLYTIVGNQQVTVGWTAPSTPGELPITSYTVVSNPGGFTATTSNASTTRAVVTGLTNGIPYTFTVYANTSGGQGVSSAPSAAAYPSTVPSAPHSVIAAALGYYGAINVSWQVEANGGIAITSYTVVSSPGNVRQTVTVPYAVYTGLDPNTSYTFSVYATNANGSSGTSTSNAVNASSELVYLEWIKQLPAMNSTGTENYPKLVADAVGNTYITYYTTGTVSGGTYLGSNDIVVAKMNTYGQLLWIKEQAVMNTTGTDSNPTIAVDASGNSYVSYYTTGTVSGGTNLGGSGDIVVFKMDTNGTVQWIKEQAVMNTTGLDAYPTIAVDASGNSYVSYYTGGTVSGGTYLLGYDIVVIKMDTNGTVQWIKEQAVMNTTGTDYNPTIAVDASGNSYVSYYTTGIVSGGTFLGSYDAVVFKMDTNGTVQWIKEQAVMNTIMSDYNPTIVVDASGNSYVSYYTFGTVSGGTFFGSTDIVVFKMDTNGTVQWIQEQTVMNTTTSDYNPTIVVDASGNCYVSYYTFGTVSGGTFMGGTYDIVVFKMDTNGTVQWIKEQAVMNTTGTDYYPTIAIDSSKNIYVSYYTGGTVSGGTFLGGTYDIVVLKMAQHVVSAPPTPTVTAVAGNLAATVTWSMPPNPLVNPITSYTITSNRGDSVTVAGNVNSVTFTNLSGQGTSYTFTIVSTNSLGTSTATSNTITVYKLADAPTISGVSGNGQVTLNWLPPASTGDGAITSYTITWVPGNGSFTTADNTASSFTVGSLTNGTIYKFTIVANGPYGAGNPASVYTTPSTVPSSVVISPMKGNRYSEMILNFSCNTGGASIIRYNVTMNPGNIAYVSAGAGPLTLTNLDPTVGYTFTATATNVNGTSTVSSASAAFNPSSDVLYMDWIKQNALMNSSSTDYYPRIAIDGSGNSYVAYYTTGTVSGGTYRGSNDIVVFKMDTNGTILWIKEQSGFNTPNTDQTPAIVVDNSGNSYVTFSTTGTVSGGTNKGSYDAVVFKMDTNGNVLWIKQQLNMNTSGNEYNPFIALDPSGNIYLSYQVSGTVSGGTFMGNQDISVAKMDNNGNLLWIKQPFSLNTTNLEASVTIGADSSGNAYITYYTASAVSGGTNKGSNDIVVAKLDTNGNLVWIKQQLNMNTTGSDSIPFIAVDGSGNSYITYYTSGTVSSGTNLGSNDIVVFKMDSNGNLVWIKETTSVNSTGAEAYPTIAIDNSGNSYVTYYTSGTVSGGTNMGQNDIAFFKMDTNGNVQWVKQQSLLNAIYNEYNPTIAVDKTSGTIYLTYYTYGSVSGGQNIGDRDIVVTKYSTHGTSAPSSPTNVAVSGGDAQANISWSHPFNGNSIITSYTVTAQPGNITYTTPNGLTTFATITGLTNNITYTFTITATNAIGTSSASSGVTATPTNGNTVPDPPTSLIASADYGIATVSWTPPLNTGGLALTGYVVVCSPASNGFITQTVSNTATSATFSNLLNGITYNFTVKSVNSLGQSVASQATTASYTDPTVSGTLQSALTDPTAIQTYLSGAITSTKTIQDNYTELRNSLKAANYTVTDTATVRLSMVQAFQTTNASPILRLGPAYMPFFFNSVSSITRVIPPRGIQVVLPTYTGNTATYDFTTSSLVLDGTQYVHLEIPAGYSITITDNLSTKTFSYDGVNLSDGTTTYSAGNVLTIGQRSYIVAAIGSVTLLPVSPNKMVILANNNGIIKTQGGFGILAVSVN